MLKSLDLYIESINSYIVAIS